KKTSMQKTPHQPSPSPPHTDAAQAAQPTRPHAYAFAVRHTRHRRYPDNPAAAAAADAAKRAGEASRVIRLDQAQSASASARDPACSCSCRRPWARACWRSRWVGRWAWVRRGEDEKGEERAVVEQEVMLTVRKPVGNPALVAGTMSMLAQMSPTTAMLSVERTGRAPNRLETANASASVDLELVVSWSSRSDSTRKQP
ncbi:hypothetical protein FB45DRAFT_941288, partial [Roridomyces roridus]